MRCHAPKFVVVLLCVSTILSGCAPQQPLYFRNSDDLSHYVGISQQIENPDLPEPPFSEVEGTIRPFALGGATPKEYWDLTLEEAMRCALKNGKVLRQLGGAVVTPGEAAGVPDFLTRNAAGAPTIYDPAIVETDARFGINTTLSLFDPQLNSSLFWERNHEPRNAVSSLPQDLNQDLAGADTTLTKTTADGTTLSLSNSTAYDLERDNTLVNPSLLSDWTTSFGMEIRRPLLQGYGVEYNRIAGPGAIPGFNQGVLLARLNADISLTRFEASVRDMVSDVEKAYWTLYSEYRSVDAWVKCRDEVLKKWQEVKANGEARPIADEAFAREQYFSIRTQAENAQKQLYHAESLLRYMMGIAATDGRLIRPVDEPPTAKISFDWSQVQGEAMTRSPDIRQARWQVKQRELELIAAKNYLLPRLDLDARYRWLGLGDKLIDHGNNTINGGAFDNMAGGQYQDWHIGIDGQIPLGFRKQKDGVKNAELALMRDRAKLREIELEVSHQVAFAVSDMEAQRTMAETNFNHLLAADRYRKAIDAVPNQPNDPSESNTFINKINAYRELAQTENDYFNSTASYAISIAGVHYRKGSLLEYNGVYLTEGPWPAKAYFDARRRARSRSAALYLDYGYTYPKVLSSGPNPQFTGPAAASDETPAAAPGMAPAPPAMQPTGKGPEEVPAPQPSGTAPKVLPAPPAPRGPVTPGSTAAVGQPARGTHEVGAELSSLAAKADDDDATPDHAPAVRPAEYSGR